MKKFFALLALVLGFNVLAADCDTVMRQLDAWGSEVPKLVPPPSGCTGARGVYVYDTAVTQPLLYTVDSTLTLTSNQLRVGAVPQANVTGLAASLASKFNNPAGSTAQYLRGDGSVATFPAIPSAFNFGFPAARTLAVSTSYQAVDPSKPAIIYPSYACTNATQVLVSSACTLQVRMHTSAVTCGTGTVYYTQSLTVNLGVLLTQNSTNPVPIFLPVGAFFILCPTAGTFTATTVEQAI